MEALLEVVYFNDDVITSSNCPSFSQPLDCPTDCLTDGGSTPCAAYD